MRSFRRPIAPLSKDFRMSLVNFIKEHKYGFKYK